MTGSAADAGDLVQETFVTARILNGLPAVLVDVPPSGERFAPRFVLRIDLGCDGRIEEVHAILATRKLTAVAAECGAAL